MGLFQITTPYAGFFMLLVLGILLNLISHFSMKSRSIDSIDSYLLADRNVSAGLIASSSIVAWTWTTTIMGAAEAGMVYGVSGGIGYSLGASVSFFVFIPIILKFRKIMPDGIAYTEFIGVRFGEQIKSIFIIFSVLVMIYIFIEQLIGIGMVFKSTFDLPYKVVVSVVAAIVVSYVIRGGMRGFIKSNILIFILLFLSLGTTLIYVTAELRIDQIYLGLHQASINTTDPNYNMSLLLINSVSGVKYGVIAAVVAMGQVLLDQGYYTLAMSSRTSRNLVVGFLLGTVVAWIPISILSANVFGHGAIALNMSLGQEGATAAEITTYIIRIYGGPVVLLVFSFAILLAGVSSGGNCLIGSLSIFTIDFYKHRLNPEATDEQKIRFGKIITVCFALLCAFIAIALDGISLLEIDMFSGIFFAAPCGILLVGFYTRYSNRIIIILALVLGLLSGLSMWIHFDLSSESWFYGCLLSFLVPVFIIFVTSPFQKNKFNFAKLKFYRF